MGFSGTYHLPTQGTYPTSNTPAIAYVSEAGQAEAAAWPLALPAPDVGSNDVTVRSLLARTNAQDLSSAIDEVLNKKKTS